MKKKTDDKYIEALIDYSAEVGKSPETFTSLELSGLAKRLEFVRKYETNVIESIGECWEG